MKTRPLITILFEHPEWHEPLFSALRSSGIGFDTIDLKKAAYDHSALPENGIYYNMVSPSAYLRGNQRAIPFALSLCHSLELLKRHVINGSGSMRYEFSKSAQIALLQSLNVDHPKSFVFNDLDTIKGIEHKLKWPMILKPEQGGSGAKMYIVQNFDELENLFASQPNIWFPDNLFLLQEKLDYDPGFGIVRLEFVGQKFLYAMRVKTFGGFNLCPSVVCNPEDGSDGNCEVPEQKGKKPEFFAYQDVPELAIQQGISIMKAAGHQIGSVEYVNTSDGRRVFYDINSNSNLRQSVAEQFGINPFEKVTDYLIQQANSLS